MSARPVFPSLEALADALAELVAERVAARLAGELADTRGLEHSPWMGIERAAAYLDCPKQRLYKLTAAGAIPHYKQEGRLFFHRGELDAWLRAHAAGSAPRLSAEAELLSPKRATDGRATKDAGR